MKLVNVVGFVYLLGCLIPLMFWSLIAFLVVKGILSFF